MKKFIAVILVAVMLVATFAGCAGTGNTTSGGAASCDELMATYETAVVDGNPSLLRPLFSSDHFASDYGSRDGTDEAGNLIIYNFDTLREQDFFGECISPLTWTVVGQNTNEAELAVMGSEMYATDLELTITEEYLLNVHYQTISSAVLNAVYGNHDYYEQTLDVVCIDGQYYIQSVTLLSETVESGSDGNNGLEPEYYTLEQAKELGGYFILRDDRFYPLLEAYDASWNGYDYYVTAISDVIPEIGDGDQLVEFTDSSYSTSVSITSATDLGATIPLALVFHDELGYCISDLFFYSNTEPRIAEELAYLSDEVWEGLHKLAENIDENYIGSIGIARGVVIDNISGVEDISSLELLELETSASGLVYSFMLKCSEGEWVTIGYFIGTSYYEFEIPAVARYWATGLSAPYKNQTSYELELEKTREGYFVVPLDELSEGVYAISNYELFEIS